MKQREVILIFGKTGSGKTTLAKKVMAKYSRIVVFDQMEEYSGGLVLEDFEQFVQYFRDSPPDFFVVCRFRNTLDYEFAASALWFIGDLLLVMEEADKYLESTSFNEPDNPYNDLVQRGRHKKISLLAITQHPHLIAKTLRGMVTNAVVFRIDEPGEVAYLGDWGFDEEEVRTLGLFQYVTLSKQFDHDGSLPEKNPLP